MKSMSNPNRCTESDYRSFFATSTEPLRWLCYTLTGDQELSEKAVDAALRQSLRGADQVFREWMLSWARRLIINFCIAKVRPALEGGSERPCSCEATNLRSTYDTDRQRLLNLPPAMLQQRLLRLDVLSRFVFVLRAMEGYSRRDTALLLNIDDRLCEIALSQATRTLSQLASRTSETGQGTRPAVDRSAVNPRSFGWNRTMPVMEVQL